MVLSLLFPLISIITCGLLLTPLHGESPDISRSPDSLRVRIMTYNIRFDNPDDGVHAWSHRKDTLLSFVRSQRLDILCIQEGLHGQVIFLKMGQPRFGVGGVGRDDGREKGEYSAIFYDTTRFACGKSGTFWLSPHPEIPARGWDAALPRIVTWLQLRDTLTNKTFFVFNTHFDHMGAQARENSARLIRNKIREIAGESNVVLAGDFNSTESDPPYRILVSDSGGRPRLVDAAYHSQTPPEGPSSTFAGFEFKEPEPGNRIDCVFVSDGVKIITHRTMVARRTQGYLSDHLPVVVEFELP
jgi:endonuclease/exonuclease/phosphatase family metal-dependent hydrolase